MIGTPLQVDSGDVSSPLLFFDITECFPFCPTTIHPSQGWLSLTSPLDFELVPRFALNVTVTNGLAMDSILVILQVMDMSDCLITSIQPSFLDADDNHTVIWFEGMNLGPLYRYSGQPSYYNEQNSTSLRSYKLNGVDVVNVANVTINYEVNATLMDDHLHPFQTIPLNDCELQVDGLGEYNNDNDFNGMIICTLPRVLAYSIQWNISWHSSLPEAIHHQCSVSSQKHNPSSSSTFFEPIRILSIHTNHTNHTNHEISQMPTSGTNVCFDVLHAGSNDLYDEIPDRNAITAFITLNNSTTLPLTDCQFSHSNSNSNSNSICCEVGEGGVGSTVVWDLCLYGQCDSINEGGFHPPTILNITTNGDLGVNGGDSIEISGLDFGGRDEDVRVYMMTNSTNSTGWIPLPDCHLMVKHTLLQCTSIGGVGTFLSFCVEVGGQFSAWFETAIHYERPVIHRVYGPGSEHALTQGGQTIFVAGLNLGREEDQPSLRYGKFESDDHDNHHDHDEWIFFTTPPCHVEIPHTLLRCTSVEGGGFQNAWMVVVQSQHSNLFTQHTSIYGNPLITSIRPEHTPLPIEGGLSIQFDGINFGQERNAISVEYRNEDGIQYHPPCNLTIPHTQLVCQSLPGYGLEVRWIIRVYDLELQLESRLEGITGLSYAQPVITEVICKGWENGMDQAECGNPAGGEFIYLLGHNFAPLTASVTASYGFTGHEFIAGDCVIQSTTQIECRTSPGVGRNLRWTIAWMVASNQREIQVDSSASFSYSPISITYPSNGIPLSLDGHQQVLLHLSNNLTGCSLCSIEMVFNGVSTKTTFVNSTTISSYTPVLHTIPLHVYCTIRYDEQIVETTNSILIPLQPPFIQSYMIVNMDMDMSMDRVDNFQDSHNSTASTYLLSLLGENFGYEQLHLSVTIQPAGETQTVTCEIQSASNHLITCCTTYPEGIVTFTRISQESNSIHYRFEEVYFDTQSFISDGEGYLQYPSLFNTSGGDVFQLEGLHIPQDSTVTVGPNPCMISHANSTHISCIIPPGEGEHLPIRIQAQQRMLLQLFASYHPPVITAIRPSTLLFTTDLLTLEGTNFGIQPIVELSGLVVGEVPCADLRHSHTWIQCNPATIDPMGLMMTVVVGGQRSNVLLVHLTPPSIDQVEIRDAMDHHTLSTLPRDRNVFIHIHGFNLNSPDLECIVNDISIPVYTHSELEMICYLEQVDEFGNGFGNGFGSGFGSGFGLVYTVWGGLRVSVQTEFHHSNSILIPYESPRLSRILPNEGPTTGGQLLSLHGFNFICNYQSDPSNLRENSTRIMGWIHSMEIWFGRWMIEEKDILSCNHSIIQILSPPGQGTNIPVRISPSSLLLSNTTSTSTLPIQFHFSPPIIQSIEYSPLVQEVHTQFEIFNQTTLHPSNEMTSQTNLLLLTIRGMNFGIHSAEVLISGEECAILHHNHTLIQCLAPLFVGGRHPLIVIVSGQISNTQYYSFPLPIITEIHPLLLSANHSTIHIYGVHIYPSPNTILRLRIANHTMVDCHFSTSSSSSSSLSLDMVKTSHFIECHLPTLPRGQWPIQLYIGDSNATQKELQEVVIPPAYNQLTVVCPLSFYAKEGFECKLCPSKTTCPHNTTHPIASPGYWINQVEGELGEMGVKVHSCPNPQVCLGGNVCEEGYYGDRCSQCDHQYVRYGQWVCQSCPSGWTKPVPLLGWILVCGLLLLASIVRDSNRFAWYGLLMDALQLIGLLAIFRDQTSHTLAPIIDLASAFLLDVDVFKLGCLVGNSSGLQRWSFPFLSILLCLGIEVVRVVTVMKKKRRDWKTGGNGNGDGNGNGNRKMEISIKSGQIIQYFHAFFMPILYHTLQTITCNHRNYLDGNGEYQNYFMEMDGFAMCYWNKDYWWIVISSILLLIGSILLIALGIRSTSNFSPSNNNDDNDNNNHMDHSHCTNVRKRRRRRRRRRNIYSTICQSILTLFHRLDQLPKSMISFLSKLMIASIIILFRHESHLQAILLLGTILPLLFYIKCNPPFHTTQHFAGRLYARDTIQQTFSPSFMQTRTEQSKIQAQSFAFHTTADKRFPFHLNQLSLWTLILFTLLFSTLSRTPSLYTLDYTQSNPSLGMMVLDSSLVVLSVLLLVFLLLSGCGEMMSMWMNKPNGLVDVSQKKELVSENGEDDELVGENVMSVDVLGIDGESEVCFSQASNGMIKDGDQSNVLASGGEVIALAVNATAVFDKEIRLISSISSISSNCSDCQ